jgi:hypothetical protein
MAADHNNTTEFNIHPSNHKPMFLQQYGRGIFGVRMEYPLTLNRRASVAVQCGDYRTTEENYDACLRELYAALELLGMTPDQREVKVLAYRSSGE